MMKWRDVKSIPWRIKALITREFAWTSKDGTVVRDKEPWDIAWAIAGPQVWSWWWVRKWGDLPCGCTKNPLTRRLIVHAGDCTEHSFEFWGD